ncbi:MAG TPA: N-acetylneuraminate synthase family protein [Acidobacteriota bacterium]|nr:N-acetylneuraminate synthase family protein [Acidobacteriota bacterium]
MQANFSRAPLFVAEVSSNHQASLNRSLRFIDVAAAIGCQAVKFQLFKIDHLFAPEILSQSERHRARKEWELPLEFIPELSRYAHRRNLLFSCTPFYLDAVQELLPYVDFFKIASYELLWDELLASCAETGKPIVLSTGMATLEEIRHAVNCLRTGGCVDLTLLHCVSGYPTPIKECNLKAIDTLRTSFDCPVGWSDHSVSSEVICRAVHRWEAAMVEFHLDLDGQGEEYGGRHCWLPTAAEAMISSVRRGQVADGDGRKEPAISETIDRQWRADPIDGLRPLQRIRQEWRASQ